MRCRHTTTTPALEGPKPSVRPIQDSSPPAFDAERCRGRNLVERALNQYKRRRSLATRYDKLAAAYRAGAVLRAARLADSLRRHAQTKPRGTALLPRSCAHRVRNVGSGRTSAGSCASLTATANTSRYSRPTSGNRGRPSSSSSTGSGRGPRTPQLRPPGHRSYVTCRCTTPPPTRSDWIFSALDREEQLCICSWHILREIHAALSAPDGFSGDHFGLTRYEPLEGRLNRPACWNLFPLTQKPVGASIRVQSTTFE